MLYTETLSLSVVEFYIYKDLYTWVVTAGWVEYVPGKVKYTAQIQAANIALQLAKCYIIT